MRARSFLSIVMLLGVIAGARGAAATAGIAEWMVKTPGGHVIALSDAWKKEHGVALGIELLKEPLVTNLRRWRYYEDAIVGQTDKDFFLLREKSGALTRHKSEEALGGAIKQQLSGAPLSDWYEPQRGWEEHWFPVLHFRKCRAQDGSIATPMSPLCERFLSPKGLALQRRVTWGQLCAQRAAQPPAAPAEGADLEIEAYCKLVRDSASPPVAAQWQPHAARPIHPPEVLRIMTLLPQISNRASVDEIIAQLGLPKKWDGGAVSATECTMVWNLTGGYKFSLSFDPIPKKGKLTLEFREASFSAPNKPGFPTDEHHTVFPYRSWQGMRYK
jgi:hypothetical protein